MVRKQRARSTDVAGLSFRSCCADRLQWTRHPNPSRCLCSHTNTADGYPRPPRYSPSMAAAERPSPPKLLYDLMAEDRAAGFAFDDIWLDNLRIAAGKPSSSWYRVLASTRDEWRAAYERMPGPRVQRLSLDLLDDDNEGLSSGTVLA
jgi:hypothetical protein